ncbi:alpha/beta hydrolase [Chitinilyticum piscinae]|uniref:Alpha/beta hydrolase n=1 Tax=Chitinilyticum piscinae TaxID=2866724 RepID=A0A8J7FMP3_9NEIS|nr:alpha/beta hydrolase fold domain-containing protein [Chitinilyticum piscinae]MBE9608999.1 alpha/beta hydrolase [Chitinilyticum piscinae]
MAKTIIQGRLTHKLRSLAVSCAAGGTVLLRRLAGRPLVAAWPPVMEYATLFWHWQFNHALRLARESPAECRAYFDSLYAVTEDYPDVSHRPSAAHEPRGDWYIPQHGRSTITLLHFHGGGYAFHAAVSRHFAASLAHYLGVSVFAPDYRLTPEHPHPAQRDDALAAYRHLLASGVPASQIVLCGDSAGGHLALMTLAELADAGLPQPLLTLALSPWTDTGERGASLYGNDRFDLVQGYMTQRFAQWLKGGQPLSDAELSPITRDYRGQGPIYLQVGGREILVDMIRDFARSQAANGAQLRLDVWPEMNHEFHAFGRTHPDSHAALLRLREALDWAESQRPFPPQPYTEIDTLAANLTRVAISAIPITP